MLYGPFTFSSLIDLFIFDRSIVSRKFHIHLYLFNTVYGVVILIIVFCAAVQQ